MTYDSTADTLQHIRRVSNLLNEAAIELLKRANRHDDSKLKSPEKEQFDIETPLLKSLVYGSPEYKESLKRLGVALRHHYQENSHHPEHYSNGIDGMDIFDLVEMFFDWKAATERTQSGCIYKSVKSNKDRFNMSPQLVSVFENTAKNLGYKPHTATQLSLFP